MEVSQLGKDSDQLLTDEEWQALLEGADSGSEYTDPASRPPPPQSDEEWQALLEGSCRNHSGPTDQYPTQVEKEEQPGLEEQRIDTDLVRRDLAEHAKPSKQNRFFHLVTGENRARLLGTGTERPYLPVGTHWINGRPELCPLLSLEQPCPICEVVSRLESAGKRKQADALRARQHYWFRVIIRGREEEGPGVLQVGPTIWKPIAELLANQVNLTDPEIGRDLYIRREGEGWKTRYTVHCSSEASLLQEMPARQWIEEEDLSPLLKQQVKSYEKLQELAADILKSD